jgi:hypothetical protein
LYLQIVRDAAGTWTVQGLPKRPVANLATLSASLDYARRECAAAPATIELSVDGFYAVIYQEDGWPRRLLPPDCQQSLSVPLRAGSGVRAISIRFRDWLRRPLARIGFR